MHARQQTEIAAWLAVHSANLLAAARNHDGLLAEYYWTNSKSRAGRWNTALKIFADDFSRTESEHNPWPAFEIIAEEIFLSEMLTRVWSAYLVSFDVQAEKEEFSGLAYSVFITHVEAKNRVFRLLLSAQGKNEPAFERLNQLRRLVEKWTDLFLAWLPNPSVAQKFAFDKKRLADFAQERGYYNDEQAAHQQQVLITSMMRGFSAPAGKWAANPELNRRILDGIVACLDQNALNQIELPAPLARFWMEKAHTDTQLLVERLNQLDALPQVNSTAS